jgi:NAD(P)-dependent dehydrogenase (short-subunit alcohol dehydrogenase family)
MKKTVLITGASRGLGRELAHHFLKKGWCVLVTARDHGAIAELIAEGAHGVWGSITTEFTRGELVDMVGQYGVDLLIHNAGTRPDAVFMETDDKQLSATIITNLMAPILLTKRLWGALKATSGMIVFINSLAGKCAGRNEAVYAASKYGLRGFAESLQYDAVKDGLRVLSVFPGAMKTAMCNHREDYDKLIDPEEVATTIYQLCADRPSLRVTEVDLCRRQY